LFLVYLLLPHGDHHVRTTPMLRLAG
jgi:hypothetical protein